MEGAYYIRSVAGVSPQGDSLKDLSALRVQNLEDACLPAAKPDYSRYIKPRTARRMGHLIKMGVYAAMDCLERSGIENPDAIICGTGLGCVADTVSFLSSIYTNEEQTLPPTPFIQSTHNTVAAQIALLLKCQGYNYTYVHRGFSFESALLDAMAMLSGGSQQKILVGGGDEITDTYLDVTSRMGMWKKGLEDVGQLYDQNTPGSVAGEGQSFFLLSGEAASENLAKLAGVEMIFRPHSEVEVLEAGRRFLDRMDVEPGEIDVVMLGLNGDHQLDQIYDQLSQELTPQATPVAFKHLCGDYMTASAFGMWLASEMIRQQRVPEVIKLRPQPERKPGNVLIYNHYCDINHSFILLSQC